MGYRSEVALAVSAEALPHLMAKLATCEKALKMVFNEGDNLDTNYRRAGALLVTWDYIKWYDSYEEVQCIEDFMNDMDSMTDDKGADMDEQYRFCRIGENMDDIEERGYLESFDIRRSITI
tara:strand:+ start:73 stop:435 length:363 start_codon:yes stop_codon:yes gene_type:complete